MKPVMIVEEVYDIAPSANSDLLTEWGQRGRSVGIRMSLAVQRGDQLPGARRRPNG